MLAKIEQKKSRGRPQAFSRQDVINDALQLFWTYGFHQVSVCDIAKKAGLSRTSFYNSFTSKEDLLRETLQYYFSLSPNEALTHLPEGTTIAHALENLIVQVCTSHTSDPLKRGCFVMNCINEITDEKNNLARELKEGQQQQHVLFEQLFKKAIVRGELPKTADSYLLANMLMIYLAGLSTYSKTERNLDGLIKTSRAFLRQLGFAML